MKCKECVYWNDGRCCYEPLGSWDLAPCEMDEQDEILADAFDDDYDDFDEEDF